MTQPVARSSSETKQSFFSKEEENIAIYMYIYMARGLEFWLQNYSKEAKGKGLRLHRNDEISFNISGHYHNVKRN